MEETREIDKIGFALTIFDVFEVNVGLYRIKGVERMAGGALRVYFDCGLLSGASLLSKS